MNGENGHASLQLSVCVQQGLASIVVNIVVNYKKLKVSDINPESKHTKKKKYIVKSWRPALFEIVICDLGDAAKRGRYGGLVVPPIRAPDSMFSMHPFIPPLLDHWQVLIPLVKHGSLSLGVRSNINWRSIITFFQELLQYK